MGLVGGFVKRSIKLILYLAVVVLFIIFIPNLPPYTKFTRIELEPTQPREGALAPNDVLNNAQALYKDKLLGPEAFQVWNGEIYTGLATGEIVKVSPGGHVTFVTKIGQPCRGVVEEHICGRPLGFVIDEQKKVMYVADAYLGIWKVNLLTDKKQLLVSPHVAIDGRVPMFFNSVALDKNGDLYWTDSSSDFKLKDGTIAALVDPTGRLFHYNTAKNISNVLLDDLWLANGLIVSPDNQFVLVAETFRYRLIKYYINGPKKGNSEVFVAGLPGTPDVLRPLPDGSGLLVSLYTVFDDENPLLTKTMSSTPLARKFIARLVRLVEIPFEFLHSLFPNDIFENIVYQIGHFGSISSLTPGKTGIVQIDWNGNIIASYYNTDGSLLHISDAIVVNNKLYTGCPHLQNFIGSVPAPPQLIKAFTINKATPMEQQKVESKSPELNKPKVEEKKEVPKNAKPVTQTIPQPTTTQKPTTKYNEIPKDQVVKQNTVPKVVKLDSASKESEEAKRSVAGNKQKEEAVKPKVATKNTAEVKNDNKPKVVPKQPVEKPKVVPKDDAVKSNVASKDTDSKPKVASQAEVKSKVVPKDKDTKHKASTQTQTTIKNQASQEKTTKETEKKVDIPKTYDKDVKAEASIKESVNSKTVTDQTNTKTTKETSEPKSGPQNAKTKPVTPDSQQTNSNAQADKKSPKNESAKKVIPIVETIPSDTAKPKKDTLKVIKKTGPHEIPNPNL